MVTRFLQVMMISLLPWVELRFAIPFGITKGLHPVFACLAALVATWAMIIPVFLFLDMSYHRFLTRVPWIHWGIEEVRHRGRSYVERWGVLGVGIYVSLPIPGPGLYSGAVLAWVFGLPRRQAMLALALGTFVSAMLVTIISTGVIALVRRFV